jgi:GTP-binding protein LepA
LQGVIVYFRVVDGELAPGDIVKLMNTKKEYEVDEVGVLAPHPVPVCFARLCPDVPLFVSCSV